MEPYRLRRWRRGSSPDKVAFFTCARPGRSKSAWGHILDDSVDKWVQGLPNATEMSIVSLLGRKQGLDGVSEFSFYSFCGGFDTLAERHGRLSFQQWLDQRHTQRSIQVLEHPTIDFRPVPLETLGAAAADINRLLSAGRTVILMDSGGETRTRTVCKHMAFVEDTRA